MVNGAARPMRREVMLKYPPPYHLRLLDASGRVIRRTRHDSMSGLEVEVAVAQAMIRSGNAGEYEVDGVPKELVLSKFEARHEMTRTA